MQKELKPYAFIDRKGNPMTRERHLAETKERENSPRAEAGEAYGFFYCDKPKEEIEKLIPEIREMAQTPGELELTLTEGINPESFPDQSLRKIAEDARTAGINYSVKAVLPHTTNKRVADELADVLNQSYQSQLYSKGDNFLREVVFEERGNYQFRE